MGFMDRLASYDAYPKMVDDFRVRTFSGAAVSICAGVIMLILFASELSTYMSPVTQPELFVDTSRGQKMRINLDVTLPHLPCAWLSVDVMDISGEQRIDIHNHDVFMQRLGPDGSEIHDEEKHEPGKDQHEGVAEAHKVVAAEGLDPNRCESCYGAESEHGKCCNTCEQVREAYRRKGWAFTTGEGILQCEREGWVDKIKAQANEGCQIYGFLEVNKVAGNFHIAPGRSFQLQNVHMHDLQSIGRASFNLSHTINHLSFGTDYPGMEHPLDGHVEYMDKELSRMYQYFVKVVPTIYKKRGGESVDSNQFSVTLHGRDIDHAAGQSGLPGVFFMFEISPLVVQLTESNQSFLHFVTGLCAIIGGIFTVAGLIDSCLYNGMRSMRKKRELGKL